jgi:two-component system, chemotaxis family, CheB/CheR fusion protein
MIANRVCRRSIDRASAAPPRRRLTVRLARARARLDTDVTEQKRSEEERTALLERERTARAEAEAALRMRDTFFAGVTHDLKNPLGGVKGYVQLLKRRLQRLDPPPPDWLTDGVEVIERSANRAVALIEDLLDVARRDSMIQLEPRRELIDLVALCQSTVDEQQRVSDQHDIVFTSGQRELFNECDRGRLERVINNLIENAIRYSPDGGRIDVTLDCTGEPPNQRAVLPVRDTGVGIPAADLSRIYDQFHRASNVRDLIPGTGIGLTSSRQIVEAHGGSIAVDSQEGVGTVFTVELPLSADSASN